MTISGKQLLVRVILLGLLISLLTFLPPDSTLADGHMEEEDQMNMGSDDDSAGAAGMDSMPMDSDDASSADPGMGDRKMASDDASAADSSMGGIQMDSDDASGADSSMGGMQMGTTDSWQDQINRVSYPTTAVVSLLAVWVCVLLMKATGMVDKFGLIAIGLGLFVVQAIFGVLYYLSDGDLVTMPTLMFVMSLATSLALLLIGGAFYKWKRMIQ